jgi:hypothetical protein
MRLLTRLERHLGRFAVPNLTLGLIACQAVTYVVLLALDSRPEVRDGLAEPAALKLALIPDRVLAGEVWRLATFLLLPPTANLIVALLFWYFWWLMGTALEGYWGAFRYNVYLLVGYLAAVGASFLAPDRPAGNAFLEVTVFLAFAWLNPDFPVALFFVLPVPIKWLARLTWLGLVVALAVGDWPTRALVLASVANFLLFFGRDLLDAVRTGQRRMARRAAAFAEEGRKPDYYHKCRVCGATDRSHPQTDFRYCSRCAGTCCYCAEHLKAHEHVTELAP